MKRNSDHSQFGETLRTARIDKRMSLREVAKKLEISPSYLSNLELNTEGNVPEQGLIQKIASLLGLDSVVLERQAMEIRNKAVFRIVPPETTIAFYRAAKDKGLTLEQAIEVINSYAVPKRAGKGR